MLQSWYKKLAMEYPSILNVREAAKYLRISESIVRRLVREERIPFFKIERRYLFSRTVVDNWVKELSIMPVNKIIEVQNDASEQIWNKVRGKN